MQSKKHGIMKGLALFLILLVGAVLFVFVVVREVNLVMLSLKPDQWYLGLAAVAALSGGVVCWYLAFKYLADNDNQQTVAVVMWVVSFIGSAAAVLVETFITSAENGNVLKPDKGIITVAISVVSIVILVNVAGGVIFHLLDGVSYMSPEPITQRAISQPTFSAQVMPPVAFPQALETPTVAEVTTTKRQLPEPQISRFKNVANRPKLSTRATKK